MARYSAEQWGEWIEQQQESGLSVVDFCEEVAFPRTRSIGGGRSWLAKVLWQ